MKIPNHIKPKLNLLISYYRNLYSKTDERFMSKNFVYDNEGLEICTIYTLSRIEHNNTNSYDSIYYSLLDNLHTSYINVPKVDELIHNVNLSLLKLAERNDSKLIISRITKTIKALSPYLNYIIYKEQAELYQILLDYYQDYRFNTKLIDKYNELFEIVDEPLKPILIEITVMCYTREHLDADKVLNSLRLVHNCNVHSIMVDYLYLALCFREYKLNTEKRIADKLIKKCEKENNKIYLCKTYNILASLYTQQNPQLAISLLQKAIDSFDKNDSLHNLTIYKRNLGILSCMNNYHKISIPCFETLERIDYSMILLAFPYYIYSLEQENCDLIKIISTIQTLNDERNYITDDILINILELFKFKYNFSDAISLNNIICRFKCLKNELLNVSPLLKIVESEIYDISIQSNKFSIYKNFMKIFQ